MNQRFKKYTNCYCTNSTLTKYSVYCYVFCFSMHTVLQFSVSVFCFSALFQFCYLCSVSVFCFSILFPSFVSLLYMMFKCSNALAFPVFCFCFSPLFECFSVLFYQCSAPACSFNVCQCSDGVMSICCL